LFLVYKIKFLDKNYGGIAVNLMPDVIRKYLAGKIFVDLAKLLKIADTAPPPPPPQHSLAGLEQLLASPVQVQGCLARSIQY
jgi:hypothetical protein